MSSPLAKATKSLLDKAMIATHQAASHSHRIRVLASTISELVADARIQAALCLDVGCGDFTLAEHLHRTLGTTRWYGVDLYEKPAGDDPKWASYFQFDGRNLPFKDDCFDLVLLCDVLHHAHEAERATLLRESLRVAPFVLVKDHFEHGLISRTVLRAMDFVGNYGYGVSVPIAYFTPLSFLNLVISSGGKIDRSVPRMHLYEHLPVARYLLRPEWQFLALVTRGVGH